MCMYMYVVLSMSMYMYMYMYVYLYVYIYMYVYVYDWESMGKLRAVPSKFTFPKSFHPNLMATLRVGQPILQNMLT